MHKASKIDHLVEFSTGCQREVEIGDCRLEQFG